MNNNLQTYLNNSQYVNLPIRRSSDYQSNTPEQSNTGISREELFEQLGISSLVEEINKSIETKLGSYVTLEFLIDNFVKKSDIYEDEDDDSYFGDEDEDWNNKVTSYSPSSTDDELSLSSMNPISNKTVTMALSGKLGQEDLIEYLRSYSTQMKMVAGQGINIEGNVISTTLDINPFVIVESLPKTNVNPNKVYLLNSSGNTYIQYKYVLLNYSDENCDYTDGEWKRVGELNLGIDLSNYLSLRQADSRYQPKGDYVTNYELNKILNQYVRKSQVYTPTLWGENTSDEPSSEPSSDPQEPQVPEVEEPNEIIIDLELSLVSENPVANKVITRALQLKQDALIPGQGISIENGVISTTFNIDLYEFVNALPTIGEFNKIYLMEDDGRYKQYVYNNNGTWRYIGYLDVDLSIYATKEYLEGLLNPVIMETSYHSNLSDGSKTNTSVGNINSGTDIAFLKGKTFSELFDMLLFREIWPTIVPHHTISLNLDTEIVKVGSPMQDPVITTIWNEDILPINTIQYNLTRTMNSYNTYGIQTFTLDYNYPQGEYIIVSNYGNTRSVTIPAASGQLTKTVKVTYPWYVNDIEQSSLIPVGDQYTTRITLNGTPSIAIPGDLSTCNIKANLGLGFMDVAWTKTIVQKNGINYSVWTKPDSYSQDVEHEITFTYIFA